MWTGIGSGTCVALHVAHQCTLPADKPRNLVSPSNHIHHGNWKGFFYKKIRLRSRIGYGIVFDGAEQFCQQAVERLAFVSARLLRKAPHCDCGSHLKQLSASEVSIQQSNQINYFRRHNQANKCMHHNSSIRNFCHHAYSPWH